MTSLSIDFIPEETVFASLTPAGAVQALEDALRAGFDPASDFRRQILGVTHGELLLMPSQSQSSAGVKVATRAPGNPNRGLPQIQGVYLLFDAETLTPQAIMDGTALTTLRTPAVAIAAVKSALLRATTPLHVTVFGAGPQGIGHANTIADVVEGTREIASVTYVVRNPVAATVPADATVVQAGSSEAEEAVRRADVIVCATASKVPVFDSTPTKPDVIVIAVGSHDPDQREVDTALVSRAQVIVEERTVALREGGDVVMAIDESDMTADDIIPMRDVICGNVRLRDDEAVFFKSSGMSWEDVVVAEAIVRKARQPHA